MGSFPNKERKELSHPSTHWSHGSDDLSSKARWRPLGMRPLVSWSLEKLSIPPASSYILPVLEMYQAFLFGLLSLMQGPLLSSSWNPALPLPFLCGYFWPLENLCCHPGEPFHFFLWLMVRTEDCQHLSSSASSFCLETLWDWVISRLTKRTNFQLLRKFDEIPLCLAYYMPP